MKVILTILGFGVLFNALNHWITIWRIKKIEDSLRKPR